jgi:hypothetical protein
MALNCAILTYNDMAYFGFSGDVHAAPDLRRLEKLLKLSFIELRDAAVARPQRKKEQKKKSKRDAREGEWEDCIDSGIRAPASVGLSIPLSHLTSVESALSAESPVREEKVLTQLIA